MKKLTVGTVEDSGEQVTIDLDSGRIVEGPLDNDRHIVCLLSGERVAVKDRHVVDEA